MIKNNVKHLTLFDNDGSFVGEINAFTYNAKRMGSAPTISATFYSFEQSKVTKDCYVEFNGERYYIVKTPNSSKSNTDARYKYDLEFRSERYDLENIYFYDATYRNDVIVAQQTSFKFTGNVHALAEKIQQSITFSYGEEYYKVIVDEGIVSDEKFIDFQDTDVMSAMQEFYNTFELPYYYIGTDEDGHAVREFHVGFDNKSVIDSDDAIFEYGVENPLLSITRSNANFKSINKITGVGGSENLPPYYPNLSSTGEHTFVADAALGDVSINYDTLDKYTNLKDGAVLTYNKKLEYGDTLLGIRYWTYVNAMYKDVSTDSFIDTAYYSKEAVGWRSSVHIRAYMVANIEYTFNVTFSAQTVGTSTEDGIVNKDGCRVVFNKLNDDSDYHSPQECEYKIDGNLLSIKSGKTGDFRIELYLVADIEGKTSVRNPIGLNTSFTITDLTKKYSEDYITFDDSDKFAYISECGVRVGNAVDGAKITVSETKNWLQEQSVLMPSIYRATNSKERFYLAINGGHEVEGYSYDFGDNIFTNEYRAGRQVEHILKVEDLKPTIKGMTYKYGGVTYNIDQLADIAFDENDSNEVGEDNEYKHPYFYVKLNPLGFNLFDHASAQGDMTVSMTSGQCNACQFSIGVSDGKNTVQADENGMLLRDDNGNVRSSRKGMPTETPQKHQNDTTNNAVWIALKKEDKAFGTLLPLKGYQQPNIGDSFVLTNIYLPNEYIFAAEQKLEDAIKKYLIDNNGEKFNFSIKFSRIYLAENDNVRNLLNENSHLTVSYFGQRIGLYVSSFSYKMTSGEALPEISVELSENISVSRGVMQNVVSQVKTEVLSNMANIDFVAQGARSFLRKDQNDQTVHKITANEVTVVEGGNFGGNVNVGGSESVDGELNVKGKVEFHDTLNSKGGLVVGDYTEILGEVNGAKIAQDGSASFKSIRSNSLEVFTLIYNQIQATSAYTAFDDTATITNVQSNLDGTYTLTFEGNEDYIQPFAKYDIIYGIVNSLNNYGYSISGECWMNVVETHTDKNSELNSSQVRVALFSDDDVPNGTNIPPTTNMVVAHRGNNGAGDFERKDRQHTFYISSRDGSIVQLMDVTSPKLLEVKDGYSNYGIVLGKLPEDLFNYIKGNFDGLKEEDPVLYAKYIAVQNLIQVDYLGRPIKTERYRGEWNENIANGWVEGEERYRSLNAVDVTYYDTVSYEGSKYQCSSDKTIEAPSDKSPAWTVIVAKGEGVVGTQITVNKVYYAVTDTGDRPSEGWSEIFPTKVAAGKYLWTWTHIEYSDDTPDTNMYSVSRVGIDGGGIRNTELSYYQSETTLSEEQLKSVSWGAFPSELNDGWWLYTKTVTNFTDGDPSVAYSVVQVGQGSYYAGLQEYYAASDNDSTPPTGFPNSKDYPYDENKVATYPNGIDPSVGGNWSVTRPDLKGGKPYLWNFTISRDSKGNKYVVYPICIGNFAKGIKSVVEEYAISEHPAPNNGGQYPSDITSWLGASNNAAPTEEKPYQWNKTVTTYNDGSNDEVYHVSSVKGKDSTSVQWTLLTNTNRINIIDRETASQNYIDVRVGKNSSQGYEEITDNATLAADGLKVMYYVDGAILSAEDVVLYSGDALTFDDGTELALDNDIPLVVEHTVVDLFNVKRSITFVLVPINVTTITDNDIVAVAEVLVINPDYTMAIEWENNMISFTVDENKTALISGIYTVGGTVKFGGKLKKRKELYIEIVHPTAPYPNWIDILEPTDGDEYRFSVTMHVNQGETLASLPKYIEVKASLRADEDYFATSRINIQGLERGKQGPIGDVGPMVYMAGTHDSKVLYETIKEDGKVVATFMVYNGKNDYYILKKDIDKVDIPLVNTDYWRLAQRFEVIYTKMLMANFGRIASAVFYGRYMFSEYGVLGNNEFVSVDGVEQSQIFDTTNPNDPKLLSYWTPQLFLDFKGGGAKFGKLSESFMRLPEEKPYHAIEMDSSHNISVTCRASYPRVVSLPSVNEGWREDGTHCTIAYDYMHEYSLPKYDDFMDSYYQHMLIVCADGRIFEPEENYDDYYGKLGDVEGLPADPNGWIIWNGTRCKFLLLEPSSMVMLRSLRTVEGGIVWYVENASDFEKVRVKLDMYRDSSDTKEIGFPIFNSGPDLNGVFLGDIVGPHSLNRTDRQYIVYKLSAVEQGGGGINTGLAQNLYHAEFIEVTNNEPTI